MRLAFVIAGGALLLAQQASCVRVDLDSSEGKSEEAAEQALRISGSDSVVLCPLSAALGPSGNLSIVWAGYPPADDRLQLLHASVSPSGALLQSAHAIALLDSELAGLELKRTETGLEVHAVEDSAGEVLIIELDEGGTMLDASRHPASTLRNVADACERSVASDDGKLSVFRAQVEGELPLFVLSSSY